MTIKLTHHQGVFFLRGREVPDGWNTHEKTGYAWTRDPVRAMAFKKHANDKAANLALRGTNARYLLSGAAKIRDQGFDIPAGKSLRPYQEAGVYFFRNTPQAYMADEVGLGKTVMVCCAIRNTIAPIESAVIICPVNVLYVWAEHLKDWCGIEAQIVTKGSDKCTSKHIVTTFDMAKKHVDAIGHRDLLVVDEAAKIKNPKAQRTKVILGEIATNCKRTWLLSGTPIPNGRPVELWPILARFEPRTFDPAELKWWAYVRKYCAAYKGRWGWKTDGANNLEELHMRLRCGFMIRRRKTDVLKDLPELVTTVMPIAGDRALLAQEAPYKAEYLKTGRRPKVQDAGELARIRHAMGLSKVDAAVAYAQEIIEDGEKIVIFCHHLAVGRKIAEELGCDFIHGGVSGKDRAYAVKQFQEDPDTTALVLNAAGQEGITLTAASNVLLVEADWTPGNNEQRIGRCWRFGQKAQSVNARYLTIKGSLDEYILQQNLSKDANITTVVDGG